MFENLRKSDFEALLNLLEDLLVLLRADKGDGKTLGTETTGTTDTVKVRAGVAGKIVVDGQVDTLDIDTTSEDVGSDTDSLLELLELLVTANTVKELLACYVQHVKGIFIVTYRSSWLTPEWTAMEGKLHSRRSLSSSVARTVLLTKIITWLN